MKILGLDPAARCGWAHSNGEHGTWQLAEKADKHPGRRLERFRKLIYRIQREYGIDVIAAEDAGFGSQYRHVQAMHDELRGVAKLVAAEFEIPIVLPKPTQIKKWLTGNGRAKKQDMIRWVRERFSVWTDDDNTADAVAVMEFVRSMGSEG
jgi:Holliday junction resolvasome RuvABC endonuclease subunit